ncbi:hypothetical protein Y032_0112g303 [Ancylostoma ceylanicum]|uniref:Uncharacterized protein n=1 Tax=Ancylostoma ceylanicum TaxID=53326 RepID=A0A016TCZ3_9BILA|nr:hypothetical protein Y032_0112g303 [Ancylostoma ceylanicum]
MNGSRHVTSKVGRLLCIRSSFAQFCIFSRNLLEDRIKFANCISFGYFSETSIRLVSSHSCTTSFHHKLWSLHQFFAGNSVTFMFLSGSTRPNDGG